MYADEDYTQVKGFIGPNGTVIHDRYAVGGWNDVNEATGAAVRLRGFFIEKIAVVLRRSPLLGD